MKRNIAIILISAFILSLLAPANKAYAESLNETMKFEWQRTYKRGYYGEIRQDCIPVADSEGNVYVVDSDGFLSCMMSDGEQRYRVNIFQGGNFNSSGSSSPAVDKNSNAYISSADGKIYAFDANGDLRWKYVMDSGTAVRGSCILSSDCSTLYAADEMGHVYALSSNNGMLIWRSSLCLGNGCSSPVLSDDEKTVYVASNSKIVAFNVEPDVKGERLRWTVSSEKYYSFYEMVEGHVRHEKPLSVDDEGNVYAVSQKYNNETKSNDFYFLHKFSSEGKEIWKLQVTDKNGQVTPPAYHDGFLYYKISENKLYKLNSRDKNPKPELILEVKGQTANERNEFFREPPIFDLESNLYMEFGRYIYVTDTDGTVLRRSTELNGGYISKPNSKGEIYINAREFLYKYRDTYIKQNVKSVSLDSFALVKGSKFKPEVVLRDENNNVIKDEFDILLKSSDEEILKVDKNFITALKAGKTKLTASVNNIETSVDVTVVDDLSKATVKLISISGKTTIELNSNIQLNAEILIKDLPVKGQSIVWESKHPNIVNVNSDGYVKGINQGLAKITAQVKDNEKVSQYIAITVKKLTVANVDLKTVKEALAKSVVYYRERKVINSWGAYNVNGAGVNPLSVDPNYVESIKSSISSQNGVVGSQMTDYEKMAIGLLSAGQNIVHFVYDDKLYESSQGKKGYIDFIREIRNGPAGGLGQGINAAIWGLTALNAAEYNEADYKDTKYGKDDFIEYILKNKSGEGWAFGTGGSADPDMTGMALYALGPYKDDMRLIAGTTVKVSGEKAIAWLSKNQLDDGKFGSWGTINSCSLSQVIMGITSWGIDPQCDMFTKPNGNAVTALMSYYLGDGTFAYTSGYDPGFGTPQGIEALISVASYYESSDIPEKRRSTAWEHIKLASEDNEDIKSITILPGNVTLNIGQSINLTVLTDKGSLIKNEEIKWTYDSNAIKIENGRVTVLDTGNSTLTANYNHACKNYVANINISSSSGKEYELIKTDAGIIDDFENTPYQFEVKNNTDKPLKALFVVNLYKKSTNELIQQIAVETMFKPKDVQKLIASFNVPQGDYYMRVMLWESFETIKSLKDAITIQGVK